MSETILLTYPDGAEREHPAGVLGRDLLAGLPSKVRKKAIAVMIDDELVDL